VKPLAVLESVMLAVLVTKLLAVTVANGTLE
jgi:hypothetical protein